MLQVQVGDEVTCSWSYQRAHYSMTGRVLFEYPPAPSVERKFEVEPLFWHGPAGPYSGAFSLAIPHSGIIMSSRGLYAPGVSAPAQQAQSAPAACTHTWAEYVGIMNRFEYCTKCDVKKSGA